MFYKIRKEIFEFWIRVFSWQFEEAKEKFETSFKLEQKDDTRAVLLCAIQSLKDEYDRFKDLLSKRKSTLAIKFTKTSETNKKKKQKLRDEIASVDDKLNKTLKANRELFEVEFQIASR